MTKIDLVRQEMMKALKAKDMDRKNALSMLLSALKAKFIDKRADLTEDEENAVVNKEIKEARDTIETAPADRTDIIENAKLKISIYSEFVPKSMSEDEIIEIVKSVLNQLDIAQPTPQDKGKIMKTLMPLVKGKADGKLISDVVEAFIKA